MEDRVYNCLGEDITDTRIQLLDDKYGYVDEFNIPHIDWGKETQKCDKNGFDKEYRPLEGSEDYTIRDFIIFFHDFIFATNIYSS